MVDISKMHSIEVNYPKLVATHTVWTLCLAQGERVSLLFYHLAS